MTWHLPAQQKASCRCTRNLSDDITWITNIDITSLKGFLRIFDKKADLALFSSLPRLQEQTIRRQLLIVQYFCKFMSAGLKGPSSQMFLKRSVDQ